MKTLWKSLFTSSIACLAVASFSQVTPSSNGYLFRIKYKEGEKLVYKMTSRSIAKGMDMKMTMNFTSKTLSISKNIATVKYTIDAPTKDGQKFGNAQTATVQVDDRGNYVGAETGSYQMGNVSFPKDPIKVGGTWTTKRSGSTMGMVMNVKTTYKLVGVQTYKGKKVAVVTMKIENSGSVTSTGTGKSYILFDNGTPIAVDLTINMVAMEQKIKNIVTIRR